MHSPVLLVWDLDLLKLIFIKDFDHFVDRRSFKTKADSIINDMLSVKTGNEWKSLRAVMTPTFTSGKMRGMFYLVCDKADDLVSFCLAEMNRKPYTDMKHNCGRYTMDTIASCAFGIECNSLVNKDAEFAEKAESFFTFTTKRVLKNALLLSAPKIFDALNLDIDTPESKFFEKVVRETLAMRQKGQRRGDFLDLMIDARTQDSDPNGTSQAGNVLPQ